VFDTHDACNLEKVGFAIERQGGKKWEVADIKQPVIDIFSKRKDEIDDQAARCGIANAAREAELGPSEEYRRMEARLRFVRGEPVSVAIAGRKSRQTCHNIQQKRGRNPLRPPR
jgi:hypothetical protein